jgi:hypothetical protein
MDDGGIVERPVRSVDKHRGVEHLHTVRIDTELLNIGL